MELKKNWPAVPIPGVEPGPPGWKPGILTARPYGTCSQIVDDTKDLNIVYTLHTTV